MSRAPVAALGVIAGLTVLEILLPGVHHLPAMLAAFGLVGVTVIVGVTELLDWAGLTRPEPPDE